MHEGLEQQNRGEEHTLHCGQKLAMDFHREGGPNRPNLQPSRNTTTPNSLREFVQQQQQGIFCNDQRQNLPSHLC